MRRSDPAGRARASATSKAPTTGQEHDAEDVALHRHGRRRRPASEPPSRLDASSTPATRRRARSALESAIRFGFQMNVDSSTAVAETAIASPATRPATGPPIARASHHVTATAAIPPSAISAVTASGESPPVSARRRREQVVVERAVVEVADRRRRAEQRHRSRRGRARAARACRGPGRRPTCRASARSGEAQDRREGQRARAGRSRRGAAASQPTRGIDDDR